MTDRTPAEPPTRSARVILVVMAIAVITALVTAAMVAGG
ncbi:hypothetical protein NS506_06036 [Nocardia seriolae]|uniref:Uncharacterized protein n=1 Tax=Nocardia seriolae TaxID=37332 RepID=A0ABC8B1J5_9NOCA|nr:hypothetical protein NS506_06036 [Nocardia seriolae]BAW08329.1 hypothetical protein NSERUTF1_5212 [Nocardia seriolae]